MNTPRISTLAAFAVIIATSSYANGNSSVERGACHRTPEALQSWKDLWARQLRVLDPKHAVQLSKVAAEIIDGQGDTLKGEIDAGLSPNAKLKGAGGETSLLELAVAACQDKLARELVASGASADGDETSTPLVEAASTGQEDLAEFLILHGASVDKVDVNGHTALEDAVRQRQLPAVQMLLKHGSNANRQLARNATILDLAAHSSDVTDRAIAKELRAHGAANGLTGDNTAK